VIDYIVKRTKQRKDKEGKRMKGYSKSYAKTPEAQAAGKRRGQAANLNLSGDMLFALGEYTKIKDRSIEIGYKKGSEENAKADGNIRGTYGSKTANSNKARDFLGINGTELNKILKNYPLEDEEKRKKSVDISKLSNFVAKEKAGEALTSAELTTKKALEEVYGEV